ncbi:hypothetical protein HPB47_023516 [Ixodes persulcatus]|uniref:Uncharacterized protein n=1 Tax=Ixodes persulcatus TaxID=34615 RepID=A0AC60Q7B9_IXOPE|nr:hypothetical protein HPB47_023516 [Ixodes persulcatus]
MSRSRNKAVHREASTQSVADIDSDAGEGTSGQASVAAALEIPIPAVSTGDVSELMHAMTAMFATFTRQAGLAPGVANSAPTPVPHPRLSVPTPTYSVYSDAASVHDFLQDLDAYIAALGASDETGLIQIVPFALTGDAARWRRMQRPFLSMADFRAWFREEFLPREYEMRIRDELASRTQHPDESLVEYIPAPQQLYSRAEPTASDAEKAAAEAPHQSVNWAGVAVSDMLVFAPSACRSQGSTSEKGPQGGGDAEYRGSPRDTLKDEVLKIMPCSKEAATAIREAIILAKLSVIPVRRGYWGNKIGKPHTVPCKETGRCGSVLTRLTPAPRGRGIVSAPVPKKLLHMAGIEDCYTSARGSTATLGNLSKATYLAIQQTYS